MDEQKSKRQYLWICCIYLFYYASYTSYFSFLTVYLTGYGYAKSQIGLVFTCISLINLISQPLLGYLSDTRIPIKKIVLVGMFITIPGAFLLGPAVGVFPLALASILLIAFFDYSMIGLLDTWTNLAKTRNSRINYSVARGMGSLSSAVAALIIGSALARFGNETMFLFHGAFMAVALVFVFLFDGIPVAAKNSSGKAVSVQSSLLALWENKKYRYYIGAVFLVNMGWRAIVTYLPVIIIDFGGNSQHQGIAMAAMTIGIAPFMFLYPKLLKRFKIKRMIQVGYVLTIVRILSMTMITNLWMLIAFQLFEAVSFGFFQPSMIEYISNITPAKNRALAVSVASAVQLALCGTVGNYFAGIFLEYFNFRWMYLVFGIAALLGFLLLKLSLRAKNVNMEVQ